MDHKELDIWRLGIELVKLIYQSTNDFPKSEQFGLTSQLRRASVSVPTNIAEGCSRKSDKETIQFLYITIGSLSEMETLLIICEKLNFIKDINDLLSRIELIKRKTLSLIKYLANKR